MSLIDRFRNRHSSGGESKKDEPKPEPVAPVVSSSPTAPPEPPVSEDSEGGMEEMLEEIGAIQDIIGGPEEDDADDSDLVTVEMPVGELLNALPESCRTGLRPTDPDEMRRLRIVSPFDQLATGRVTVPVSEIAQSLPRNLLSDAVSARGNEPIVLPLEKVVAAVSPEALRGRAPTEEREPGVYDMPDLFGAEQESAVAVAEPEPASPVSPVAEEPASVSETPVEEAEPLTETPAVEDRPQVVAEPAPVEETAAVAEPVAEEPVVAEAPEPVVEEPVVAEAPEPVVEEPVAEEASVEVSAPPAPEPPVAPVQQETAEPAPPPAPAPEARPKPAGGFAALMCHDIDVNSADVSEMVKALPGVGPVLAQRIVDGRPYETIYDLAGIDGVGASQFNRITGYMLPRVKIDSDAMNEVLGEFSPTRPMPDLKAVTQRIVETPGVSGCVLSHSEGYLLASAWSRGKGQPIGAIAPQIFKQVAKYFALLQMDGPASITLFVSPQPVFITRAGDVFMIVFITRSRLSVRRCAFFEAVTNELVRRLKPRDSSQVNPLPSMLMQ